MILRAPHSPLPSPPTDTLLAPVFISFESHLGVSWIGRLHGAISEGTWENSSHWELSCRNQTHKNVGKRNRNISPRSQRCFDYSPGQQLSYATCSLKSRDVSKPHGWKYSYFRGKNRNCEHRPVHNWRNHGFANANTRKYMEWTDGSYNYQLAFPKQNNSPAWKYSLLSWNLLDVWC